MFIIPLIFLLSIGSVVLLAGLVSLHYFKKEEKGRFHKIIAYIATTCGSLIMIGGLVGAILIASCGSCHKGGCKGKRAKCRVEMRSDCGSCESGSKKECKKSCDEKVEKEIKVIVTQD